MKVKLFHKLLSQLENLTFTQSKQAEEVLHKKCSLESLEDVTGHVESCPHCQSQLPMEVVKKTDIIDEFSDMAESTGATVQLISQGSEEGDSLYSAFSGLAGILRYAVDL